PISVSLGFRVLLTPLRLHPPSLHAALPIFAGPRRIEVGEQPDPVILESTDAVVRVVVACVCGSDLWYYRGQSPHDVGAIGHEFVDRKSTRLNSSHVAISYAVFCVKNKMEDR